MSLPLHSKFYSPKAKIWLERTNTRAMWSLNCGPRLCMCLKYAVRMWQLIIIVNLTDLESPWKHLWIRLWGCFHRRKTPRMCAATPQWSAVVLGKGWESELSTSLYFFLLPDSGCRVTSCHSWSHWRYCASLSLHNGLYFPSNCEVAFWGYFVTATGKVANTSESRF